LLLYSAVYYIIIIFYPRQSLFSAHTHTTHNNICRRQVLILGGTTSIFTGAKTSIKPRRHATRVLSHHSYNAEKVSSLFEKNCDNRRTLKVFLGCLPIL